MNKDDNKSANQRPIRVALTERHGVAKEIIEFPPSGVEYSFIKPILSAHRFFRSPIKGYFRRYETKEHDLIEAIISPIVTKNKWIYYLANFQEANAFNILGCPLPRSVRFSYIKKLILKDNFKKLIFWSQAGKDTLLTYGRISDEEVLKKTAVVYPAIRTVPDRFIIFGNKNVNILFTGKFFIKGGVNVVDAFEMARRIYPLIKLIVCCDEKIDFTTQDNSLRNKYINKIKNTDGIIPIGRVPRNELFNKILPETDIYLLPSYLESFGYSILEAMAYGIPVIATNHFAIPEMVENEVSGFLIDTRRFACEKLFRGQIVNKIPIEFDNYVTNNLFKYMCQLIESADLRERMGRCGLKIVRNKFSFEERNKLMSNIYNDALDRSL